MVTLETPESRPAPVTPVSSELVPGIAPFLALEDEWKDLYERAGEQNPFLSWEWISTWVEHFCGDRLRTVVVRTGGRTLAIAPFHLNRYLIGPGLYTSALQMFGPKEVQHLFEIREILAEPGYESAALEAVLDRVCRGSGYDSIELSAQGAGLATLTSLAESSLGRAWSAELEALTHVPVMSLEGSWEAQRQKLKRNIKESIRHCYNSLRRDDHAHSYVSDGGTRDPREAAERLIGLHHRRSLVAQRRWHRDHFADSSIRAFQLDALCRMHEAGRARFAELSIDGQVVASRACLEAHGALYLYYSGFDPAWWKYSVMTLVVTETIRDAIARGMSTVNFSPGVDDSKSRWSPELVPMRSITLVRSNPASRARHQLLQIRKQIRQPIHRRLDQAVGVFRRDRTRDAERTG